MREGIVQQIRIGQIKQAQEEENWIVKLKEYLIGDVFRLNNDEVNYVRESRLITKWMRVGCYFSVREQRIVLKNVRRFYVWSCRSSCNKFFNTTSTQVWKEVIRGWAAPIKRSARTFIGEVYTGLSNVMWANVLIV